MDNNLIRIIKLYLKKDYKEIDLEIVLFAIKSLLKGNIDLFTEEELETIIKSFCFKNISKYFTDYEVKIINSDEINSLSKLNDVIGLVKDKTLYLERETLEELKKGDLFNEENCSCYHDHDPYDALCHLTCRRQRPDRR